MEDVDLFANADEKDAQNEDNEDEEELFAGVKSSQSASVPTAQVKGFSIFRTDDKEDDEDIKDLFIPAGADEKSRKIDIDVEDNSKLLE